MAFIFDGTAYHTARDEPGRIRAGTLQARSGAWRAALAARCTSRLVSPCPCTGLAV